MALIAVCQAQSGDYAFQHSQALPDQLRSVHRRAGDVRVDHLDTDRIKDRQHHVSRD
jgi:hypothetical protein